MNNNIGLDATILLPKLKFDIDEYEYRNMLTVASLIIDSALSRKESRGAHSRLDYTERSEDNIYHTNLVINKERELSYA